MSRSALIPTQLRDSTAVFARHALSVVSLCAAVMAPIPKEAVATALNSAASPGAICSTDTRHADIYLHDPLTPFRLAPETMSAKKSKSLNSTALSLNELLGEADFLILMSALDVGCPRSFEGSKQLALLASEPCLKELSLKGRVAFAFAVKGSQQDLTKYPPQIRAALQVVSDPTAFLARNLKLDRAAQIALVERDGTVLASYQGYSRAVFEDLTRQVTRASGATSSPLAHSAKYFEDAPRNGCPFFAQNSKH